MRKCLNCHYPLLPYGNAACAFLSNLVLHVTVFHSGVVCFSNHSALVSIIVTLKVLPRSGIHMKKACKPINHQPAICHLNHGQLPWIEDSKITLLIIHQILFLQRMQLVLMHHMTIDSTAKTREQIQGETLSDFAQFSDPMST